MTVCGNSLLRSLLGAKRTCLFALHMSAFDPKRTSNAKILAGNHKTEPVPACFKRQSKQQKQFVSALICPLMIQSGRPMPDPESALHDELVAQVKRQNRKDHLLRKGHQS